MQDDIDSIEFGLQEVLIGVISNRVRNRAVTVGDHAVGGDNGVAHYAVRTYHCRKR